MFSNLQQWYKNQIYFIQGKISLIFKDGENIAYIIWNYIKIQF